MKMTTGLAVGIGVGPFATKQPEGSSNALDVITSSNGAYWVVAERGKNIIPNSADGEATLGEVRATYSNSTEKLTEDSSPTTSHYASISFTHTAGLNYTLSMEAKSSGRDWLRLLFQGNFGNKQAYFNTSTGSLGASNNESQATITSLGDGWYRCTLYATCTTSGTQAIIVALAEADNDPVYSGDGSSGLLLRNFQIEEGTSFTSYEETTGTATYGALLDQTGGGRHLTLPGGSANPLLLDHTGTDYFWFPGTTGNNLSIAGLSNSTTYDYTVTYSDTTTNTGSETTDGSGNLVFGNTQANFNLKKVTKIEVEPSGGGALVADVRATSADPDATTFAELISALTVTINRSSTGYKTAVVDQPLYVFATDDYIEATDDALFDFTATDDVTLVLVSREYDSVRFARFIDKRGAAGDGWSFYADPAGTATIALFGSAATDVATKAYTVDSLETIGFVLDSGNARVYAGGGFGSDSSVVGAGSYANTDDMAIGRVDLANNYREFELVGMAYIKGTAWTAAEISDIADALITANGGTP